MAFKVTHTYTHTHSRQAQIPKPTYPTNLHAMIMIHCVKKVSPLKKNASIYYFCRYIWVVASRLPSSPSHFTWHPQIISHYIIKWKFLSMDFLFITVTKFYKLLKLNTDIQTMMSYIFCLDTQQLKNGDAPPLRSLQSGCRATFCCRHRQRRYMPKQNCQSRRRKIVGQLIFIQLTMIKFSATRTARQI